MGSHDTFRVHVATDTPARGSEWDHGDDVPDYTRADNALSAARDALDGGASEVRIERVPADDGGGDE